MLRDFPNFDDLLHHLYHWHIEDLFNDSFHEYVPLERGQPPLFRTRSEEHCFDGLCGDLKYPFLDLLYCASSTSVSLIILSSSSSVSFSPTFCLHVALILCRVWGCRLNSLSDRMDIFLLSCNPSRASSLCRSLLCQRHCRSTLRGG